MTASASAPAAASLPRELRELVSGLPEYRQVSAALAAGEAVAGHGLPPGARSAVLATLADERPLLVVCSDQEAVRSLQGDLEELTGEERPILNSPPLDLFADGGPGDTAPGAAIGARLRVLRALAAEPAPVVLSSASALLQRLPAPEDATVGALVLEPGGELDPADLARRLVDRGYRRVALVEVPGEFAIRGGIVDLFPLGADQPLRVELFGDTIESLRAFEADTQRSLGEVSRYALSLLAVGEFRRLSRARAVSLAQHLPAGAAVAVVDPARCRERMHQAAERFSEHAAELLEPLAVEAALANWPRLLIGEGEQVEADRRVRFPFQPAGLSVGKGPEGVTDELARQVARGERLTVTCVNEAELERLADLCRDTGLVAERGGALRRAPAPPGLTLLVSPLPTGLRLPEDGERPATWLLPSSELFTRHVRGETTTSRRRAGRGARSTAVESFADLEEGTYVVHVSYGIARFCGIVRREREGQPRDFLELEFDGGTLFIPTDRIGLVRRYVGPTSKPPKLSKLGGTSWRNKTKKAAEAVRDLAAELLEVQAERLVRPGHAFPPDGRAQRLFEESFEYTDTPDQSRVTEEVRADMCAPRAMDRVVCGDVGYGKTEIALRAAFKCVESGRQAAVLAPTTVLAHQHHRTFSERLAPYPLRVEVLSRFRTRAEQREVLAAAKRGEVDVLIGTHRLLSGDVEFRDLGLVVVDEEQRFGVADKERLKALRRTVDLLTLTATPIPRTLHMALSGARDISVLQTPPPGRSPVESRVVPNSDGLIRRAVERELARDGQVFLVHDRVRSIQKVAAKVRELVPTARVGVVHGQLPEHELEDVMLAFFRHELDVLVATSLIENGLDVRRANTLIVDRADRFGLAELHQLRGRVGRSSVHAYAYFLFDPLRLPSEVARRRLRAIEEFAELGSGFHIAMRDLEIRGAGNVLGAQQSGHIVNVGYDLYCRLLRRAMAELKGELAKEAAQPGRSPKRRKAADLLEELELQHDLELEASEVNVVLDVPAYVPTAYVADAALKIECYRRLAESEREADLAALLAELRDRFGPPPPVLDNLFALRRLRLRAAALGVLKISREARVLQLRCKDRARLERGIRKHREALRPIDTHMLYVRMRQPDGSDEQQLRFLLELLAPVGPASAATPPGADVDRDALRRERQRRLRAKEHRGARARRGGARRQRGQRSSS